MRSRYARRVLDQRLVRIALVSLLLVGSIAVGCNEKPDHEVRILPGKDAPVPRGFLPLELFELAADGTCQPGANVAVFRRPEHATDVALFTCYRGSGRTIAVPLRLPDAPWRRAGWTRCSAEEERAFRDACRKPKR